MKKCSRCKGLKSLESFNRHHRFKDGLRGQCRDCEKASHMAFRATPRGSLSARWSAIMVRCYDQSHSSYSDYGGRGITTCERWRTKAFFIADILALIGPPPAKMSLDRIDNDSGYRPGNIRWATGKQQNANQRPHRMHSNNTSGAVGVSAHGAKWQANASIGGRFLHIGLFHTVADAAAARADFIKNMTSCSVSLKQS
jgi:hypothetical protein